MTPPPVLTSRVELDEITASVAQAFDVPFDGSSTFTPFPRPEVPAGFALGVIVGGSGTGKSTLLKEFGPVARPDWSATKSIAAHFANAEDAMLRLSAAGLNCIPDWVKPYHVLSTGQAFRADLARSLVDGAVIDEFTSVVDRDVAKSASVAAARYIRRNGLRGVVLATCHRDIIEWLEPDWVFDTDLGHLDTRRLVRPRIEADLHEGGKALWPRFAPYHYLSGSLALASRTFTLWLGERPVGFYAVMPLPGAIPNAWRGHRSVVLPEFQGLGLGGRMAEAVGDILLAEGKRFFCRTAHPWVGKHRTESPKWRPTTTNRRHRHLWKNRVTTRIWTLDVKRLCWSHEYLGDAAQQATAGVRIAPPPSPKPPTPNLPPHDPGCRPPLLQLQGAEGEAVLQRFLAGERVKDIAAELGLRRSSLYRLLKWRGYDTKTRGALGTVAQ